MFDDKANEKFTSAKQKSIAARHWICELSIWRYLFFFIRLPRLSFFVLKMYFSRCVYLYEFFFSFSLLLQKRWTRVLCFFSLHLLCVYAIANEIIHHFLYQCHWMNLFLPFFSARTRSIVCFDPIGNYLWLPSCIEYEIWQTRSARERV